MCSRQWGSRKVPKRSKYSPQSATDDYQSPRLRTALLGIYFHILSQEPHQRHLSTSSLQPYLKSLKGHGKWHGWSFRYVCQFYDVKEEILSSELMVFHLSHALPCRNVKALRYLKDNNVETMFPFSPFPNKTRKIIINKAPIFTLSDLRTWLFNIYTVYIIIFYIISMISSWF